ncbi:unnamed protein product [Ectocarpus sp. 4 AP-2014]
MRMYILYPVCFPWAFLSPRMCVEGIALNRQTLESFMYPSFVEENLQINVHFFSPPPPPLFTHERPTRVGSSPGPACSFRHPKRSFHPLSHSPPPPRLPLPR